MGNPYNLYNLEAEFKQFLSAENQDLSQTSIKNYLSDFRYFAGWLTKHSSPASPENISDVVTSESLREYIRHLSDLQLPTSTLHRRLSSLRRCIAFINAEKNTNVSFPSFVPARKIANKEQPTDTPMHGAILKNRSIGKSTLDIRLRSSTSLILLLVGGIVLILLSNGPIGRTRTAPNTSKAALESGRIFSFNGKLTDSLGNPITSITPVQFKLYRSSTSSSPIYQTGSCNVVPDRNGNFSVLIGGATMSPPPPQDVCGNEVLSSLFTENNSLYLGTTINNDREMRPRKQIANVSFSWNSERLQNLPLGTGPSTIPFIGSDGSVLLTTETPSIAATSNGESFKITSNAGIDIQSSRNGNLTLNATGSGAIKFKTGGSSSDRIYISDGGNVGINTNHPATFRLEVSGDIGPDLSKAFNLGSVLRIWKDVYADRFCFDGASDCVTSSQGIFTAIDQSSSSQLSVKGNLVGGSSVTSGKTTLDIAGAGTSFALCHSSESGTDNQSIVDCSSTSTADFAEMYPTAGGAEFGDVMTLGDMVIHTTKQDEIRQLVKASRPYDERVVGIISNNFGDYISVGHNLSPSDNPLPIALKGRVPVKIASSSEAIEAGDYLTSSTEPGKAMKADGSGVVIGRALETWTPGSVKNKIMVFVGIDHITDNKDIASTAKRAVTELFSQPLQSIIAEKVVSPEIETSTITPKDEKDLTIVLKNSRSNLVIKGSENETVTTINSAGDIHTIGNLTAKNGEFSDTLTAKTIKSSTIDVLNSDLNSIQSRLSSLLQSSSTTPSATLSSNVFSLISQEALTSRLVVTDQASIASLTVQRAISSLSDNLELMAAKTISFFDNAVVFARNGNITAKGDLTVGSLQIANPEGVSVASVSATGSATFKHLQLPQSSGNTEIPAGENLVRVPYADLRINSQIYITPESERGYLDKPLFIKEKHVCEASEVACESYFVVAIGTDNHPALAFNWFVLN